MVRTARRRCLLVAIGVLLAACGPITTSAPATGPTSATASARSTAIATPIIATTTQTAPRAAITPNATTGAADVGCDNAAVTALVMRFLDAYNAGDGARLLAFFPSRDATRGIGIAGEETYFQRYWDVRKPTRRDEDGFAAYARTDLPPYWVQRHAQHERLQLLRVGRVLS